MDKEIPFFGKERYYEVHKPVILALVEKVYSHGQVVMGPEVTAFQEKIAGYCGRNYAVALGSCTDALYFSLIGCGVREGDEVLVTGFSFIASVSCILRAKAKPVFVDIDTRTYMMDLADLEGKITSKTKAIVAVDIFGDALDIEFVERIAKKYNLAVIEDAAQSIGSRYGTRKVGTLGKCSCISFDPTKILSAQSNGGVLLTDDKEIYDFVTMIIYHGKNPKTGEFEILGHNSRLSSLQAAILSYNLDQLESWIARHREIAQKYRDGLKDIKQITLPENRLQTRHVYHKFVVQAEERDRLKEWLKNNKIPAMVHYGKALHENLLFKDYYFRAENLNGVNTVKGKVLSLPINPWLTDEEVDYIVNKVKEFYLH
jgi:dTDP-4-amino-4,6-dideoxygalactose transaminase